MSNILVWNYRGLGSMPAVNALRRILIHDKPQMVFLQETKLHQTEMEKVRQKLKFKGMLAVDCEGEGRSRRGGVGLFWTEECDIDIQTFPLNHIDANVRVGGGLGWRFTGIYGFPEAENKKKTGELMKALRNDDGKPWVCGGDFNLMLWSTKKKRGNDFRFEEAAILWEAMEYYSLEDMNFVGYPYTCTNNQGGIDNIQERLDRFVANLSWRDIFGGSFVTHLEKRRSDHLPILFSVRKKLTAGRETKKQRLFRFEEMWTREEECGDVIAGAWVKGNGVSGNLVSAAKELREWSRVRFGELAKEMRVCKQQMGVSWSWNKLQQILSKCMHDIDRRIRTRSYGGNFLEAT